MLLPDGYIPPPAKHALVRDDTPAPYPLEDVISPKSFALPKVYIVKYSI